MVWRDGDAAVAHHLLEEILVHREGRRRDAGADVRDPRELEQPLHRPVLAERPVEDREDDVDGAEPFERPAVVRHRKRLGGRSRRCRAPSGRRGRSRSLPRRSARDRARPRPSAPTRGRCRARSNVRPRARRRAGGDRTSKSGRSSWSPSSSGRCTGRRRSSRSSAAAPASCRPGSATGRCPVWLGSLTVT